MESPSEKALKMVQSYGLLGLKWKKSTLPLEQAKDCALLAVEEIWNQLESARVFEEYDYWQEVKTEIEKL